LNGIDDYIRCFSFFLTYHNSIGGYRINPFTISLLLRPNSYNFNKKTSFLEIGSENGRSIVVLEKRPR